VGEKKVIFWLSDIFGGLFWPFGGLLAIWGSFWPFGGHFWSFGAKIDYFGSFLVIFGSFWVKIVSMAVRASQRGGIYHIDPLAKISSNIWVKIGSVIGI